MSSSDCRKEVEIAKELNKKRIEYKLDNANDITLFKLFFTGQWITNHDDLLMKVYSLKHKEESEYREAIKLLLAKEYYKAKESFEAIKGYKDAKEYLDVCNSLIKADNLINGKMYSEAKERLISLNSMYDLFNSSNMLALIKDLINKCDELFAQEEIDSAEFNLKMGLYSPAEEIYKRLVIKYKSNYRIWYGYLESVSRNFTSNKNESIKAIYENAIRFVPNNEEKKKLMEKYKGLFAIDSNNADEKNKDEEEKKRKEKEEELAYAEEVRKKIAEETRKKLEEEKIKQERAKKLKEEKAQKEKIKNANVGDIIEFGLYPQTVKADNVVILDNNIDENGYYTGDDGEKYALVKAKPFYSMPLASYFSNGEKIVNDKEYFFKVEPIKWKVLKRIDGKVLLFSDILLDACEFDSCSNNYETSHIRKWLNKEFYKKAFNTKQKKLIETTLVDNSKDSLSSDQFDLFGDDDNSNKYNEFLCNNTNDKLFLLSEKEKDDYLPKSYSLETIQVTTDSSLANGAWDIKGKGTYWLRTPYKLKNAGLIVDYNLSETYLLTRMCVISYGYTCVAPAMWINLQ